jgi:L-gulonate 5-dehydrogenase
LAADISESRLRVAADLGAETFLSGDPLLQTILDRTNGEGVPVVFEATGNIRAMEATVDLVAAGGRIVILGLVKRGVTVQMPALDFTRKEMTIVGSRASVNCFPESLQLLASGQVRYPKIASVFDLWDAPSVFARLAENPASVHKAVFVREG